VRDTMDGHRPAVWLSDRYGAQQNHADRQQTCLAHLARDVAYALDASDGRSLAGEGMTLLSWQPTKYSLLYSGSF